MNSREIVIVATKVFALYVLLQGLLVIPSFFPAVLVVRNFDEGLAVWPALVSLLSLVTIVGIGIGIWRISESLAAKFFEDSEKDPNAPLNLRSFEQVVLSILGLYFTISALVWICLVAGNVVSTQQFGNGALGVGSQTAVTLLVGFMELIIGMTLMLVSRGWAKMLLKLRRFGTHG